MLFHEDLDPSLRCFSFVCPTLYLLLERSKGRYLNPRFYVW